MPYKTHTFPEINHLFFTHFQIQAHYG